jgi:hypothetical protein
MPKARAPARPASAIRLENPEHALAFVLNKGRAVLGTTARTRLPDTRRPY